MSARKVQNTCSVRQLSNELHNFFCSSFHLTSFDSIGMRCNAAAAIVVVIEIADDHNAQRRKPRGRKKTRTNTNCL